MKSIIVPIDFSPLSEHALKVAATLAQQHKAEVLVVHMLEMNQAMISSAEGYYQEHTAFLLKVSEKRLSEFLDKPYLRGITVTPIIKHFKVFSELNEIAEKHGTDLVIMGSHGADGLQEIFVGSNAEKVVRHSDIPVLVIKDEITNFEPRSFVFACDFSKDNIKAFNKARDFAEALDLKFQPVYINTPGDDFLSTEDAYQHISEFLKDAKAGVEVELYNDYSVEQGVLNYAGNSNADLIGIPTHGRKGISHFFMGSIGEDIANHARIPVVTFKI